MPRGGSKPGQRRGGRKPGTPNKLPKGERALVGRRCLRPRKTGTAEPTGTMRATRSECPSWLRPVPKTERRIDGGPPVAKSSAETEAQRPGLADLRQPISRGFLHTAISGGAPGFFYARCARNQVDRRLDASSAHGPERNACGMRWRQSRARLSREKLLHLVEGFLKSTHVILRKNEGNNTLLGGTDDKLDPGPSTYREMRDVRRFRLRHGADDFPGVRLRLHRLRPEVD